MLPMAARMIRSPHVSTCAQKMKAFRADQNSTVVPVRNHATSVESTTNTEAQRESSCKMLYYAIFLFFLIGSIHAQDENNVTTSHLDVQPRFGRWGSRVTRYR
uniref:Secreted protein n=1 Tax=Panagrellus redivivus TaxID=6233 RepID=A0A7E4V4F2_PANRE